ncbi:hypothetical protein [Arthrobacter sp. STN4]|nr:hypothetical protein [Arthrobacter sp. STN4]MCQ9164017.1 hypothetical protein [Arthrobacter sp. STN4]
MLERHFAPALGSIAAEELDRRHVVEWIRARLAKGLSANTIHNGTR